MKNDSCTLSTSHIYAEYFIIDYLIMKVNTIMF